MEKFGSEGRMFLEGPMRENHGWTRIMVVEMGRRDEKKIYVYIYISRDLRKKKVNSEFSC
jgi:hypothetical protein